jgi:7-carboxy-7-deazaguanine synthase
VDAVDPRVVKVMGLKTPGSGEVDRNRYENLGALSRDDQVKFVICDRTDYQWARELIARYRLDTICEILFSPSHGQQDPTKLAEWILEDRLPVRLQLQLHKQLWGNERGR